MRTLKTKFPCKQCGAPAEVERLRDEKFATCDPCARRARALSYVNCLHAAGRRSADAGNAAQNEEGLLAEWFKGLSQHTEALSLAVKALPDLGPGDRRKLLVGSASWFGWIQRRLNDLKPRLDELADEAGFPVVDGGLKASSPPEEAVRPPVALAIVKGGA